MCWHMYNMKSKCEHIMIAIEESNVWMYIIATKCVKKSIINIDTWWWNT